jgi:hypothetical protein
MANSAPFANSAKIGLGTGLCIALLSQQLSDIMRIDENIGHEAIVDISAIRDDTNGSPAKPLFQPRPGGLSPWLV